jgi:peroxiredoxin (alkyl hydroperoxide reductase subunit C)
MTLVGNNAPEFEASAVINGHTIVHDFSLAQFMGRKEVLFFFYPKDFTFVCPTELIAFQAQLDAFEQKGVAVVACSTDTEETHLAWLNTPREKGGIQGVTYPIVADTSKTIAANYGVLGGMWDFTEDGKMEFHGDPIAYRGTFLIDKQGIVRHASVNDLSLGRSVEEMLRIVAMWHYTEQHGEVCPANWKTGQEALKPTQEGVAGYLTKHKE